MAEKRKQLVWGALALILLGAAPAQAAPTVLKIATISPDGTAWMTRMRAGAEEVESRTQGRVQFRFFPGGIMGSDQAVLRKIRIGQLQGGALAGGSLADIYPDSQIYGFPLFFNSLDEIDYVRARMDELIVKGLETQGFIAFGLAEGGFAYMMCERPLQSIQDLRQQKVWAPVGEPISEAVFRAAGITPVALPVSDVLTALQTGLIDTVATSPIAAIALQWHSRMKYLTNTPLTYLTAMLVIDAKALAQLSAADQAVVREVMGRAFKEIDAQNRRDNIAALEALRKHGIKFVEPSDAEINDWRKLASEARRSLVAKGIYSRRMIDLLENHLSAYRRAQQTAGASAQATAGRDR